MTVESNHRILRQQVTLTPRGKLAASKPDELIANGTLITDTLGREIDGADDGVAGSDYIATITASRVATGGIALARTQRHPATVADVVDHLIARGELSALLLAQPPLGTSRLGITRIREDP